jgi:hypothetical protein
MFKSKGCDSLKNKVGVSRYGKSILRYIAIHDKRIAIRIAIYCDGILLRKETKQTQIQPHVERCPPTFKQCIHMMHAGGTKMVYMFISFCEKEK